MRVLVVNAGSSALKLRLLDAEDALLAEHVLATPRGQADERELRGALEVIAGDAEAVGHRIVHGGERFRDAVAIDGGVRAALGELVELAPLHQPRSLMALDTVTAALPALPAVACFDTAFHATLPRAAATYGFHGLSHAWVARRVPVLLTPRRQLAPGPAAKELRIVSCHLGAGASLCAIRDQRSLDALEHESGLLGLAGSADMREILKRASSGEQGAALALGVYIHRLRAGIAAMAAALGGLDALAFTGEVGEQATEIRRLAAEGLGFLGVELDAERNERADGDRDVSSEEAVTRTLVVQAREDIEIARQVRSVLGVAS